MGRIVIFGFITVLVLSVLAASTTQAGVVSFKTNQLFIDGQAQPQLFGAELQYFRLRGGSERNIPRQKVIDLWNKALDRLVEMNGNAISFYIPWDFHEYAPGKFDFDGTVDEDGDGRPDYPSRDLKTFFRLIEEHGIHTILVRPGPYINAEWGFLGFGAVPLWFHDMYPNSHMRNPMGQRTPLFSYNDPDFLRESKIWFTTLYREVLADKIGPGKPISFLQVDNETNFQWNSVYKNDYGIRAIRTYREWLQTTYGTLAKLNAAHHRTWKSWETILAPVEPGVNLDEDRDWYRFQDRSIYVYLQEIRKMWDDLGVKEPNVVFTLAESYNAADHGLLPSYEFRNAKGKTGLMTVNLYPKTGGGPGTALLNNPFKADHDVKAADSANDFYFGEKQEWVMGPEIQGGWWRGTDVTDEARAQTYLTTIGHGMKAMFVYYFNEGDNWQNTWARDQILLDYDRLKADPRYSSTPNDQLPEAFWKEVSDIFADRVFAGWGDVRWILGNNGIQTPELYFDAPLNGRAEPGPHFAVLKDIGTKLVGPYGSFLGEATELTDSVCLVKDTASNVPTDMSGIDSARMNSDWASGLIGYLLQAGINPKILHWNLTPLAEFADCKLIVHQDNGFASPTLIEMLKKHVAAGGGVLNFLGDDLSHQLVSAVAQSSCEKLPDASFGLEATRCLVGKGRVYHARQPVYAFFNSDAYGDMTDVPERVQFLNNILDDLKIIPRLKVVGTDRVVTFARANSDRSRLLVTVKSGRTDAVTSHVRWTGADAELSYRVSRLRDGTVEQLTGRELANTGFRGDFKAGGSDVFFVEPAAMKVATPRR